MSEDTRTKANGPAMNVLVVDDEEPFRLLIERRLTSSRHRVECVASGEAALDRLSDRTFDVVLLDLRMPGIGGLETLRRMRNEHISCEVVVLTGFRPDLSWLSEIRLDLDSVLQAPAKLAPLIDPNVHSCGTVYPHGEAELRHPERPRAARARAGARRARARHARRDTARLRLRRRAADAARGRRRA